MDIYTKLASKYLGIPESEVTKEQRYEFKTNVGLSLYGGVTPFQVGVTCTFNNNLKHLYERASED